MDRHVPVTFEFEIPDSGRTVVMRELTGEDELQAAAEIGSPGEGAGRTMLTHALVHRAIVSIGGEPFDRSSVVGAGVRNLFSPREWQFVMAAFHKFHAPQETEIDSFLAGIRLTAH